MIFFSPSLSLSLFFLFIRGLWVGPSFFNVWIPAGTTTPSKDVKPSHFFVCCAIIFFVGIVIPFSSLSYISFTLFFT